MMRLIYHSHALNILHAMKSLHKKEHKIILPEYPGRTICYLVLIYQNINGKNIHPLNNPNISIITITMPNTLIIELADELP